MSYSIFFDFENKTYRLPVNPEEISVDNNMEIKEYEILKSGKIGIPISRDLTRISFETEIPSKLYYYVTTSGGFKSLEEYEILFDKIMASKKPVRFIATNGISNDINMMVILSYKTVEKAGEEGDKYFEFNLTEYIPFDKKKLIVVPVNQSKPSEFVKKSEPSKIDNPYKPKEYTVKAGDTLWGISKRIYDDGSQYTKILNANKDKIKNPNLIYPNQRLVIP